MLHHTVISTLATKSTKNEIKEMLSKTPKQCEDFTLAVAKAHLATKITSNSLKALHKQVFKKIDKVAAPMYSLQGRMVEIVIGNDVFSAHANVLTSQCVFFQSLFTYNQLRDTQNDDIPPPPQELQRLYSSGSTDAASLNSNLPLDAGLVPSQSASKSNQRSSGAFPVQSDEQGNIRRVDLTGEVLPKHFQIVLRLMYGGAFVLEPADIGGILTCCDYLGANQVMEGIVLKLMGALTEADSRLDVRAIINLAQDLSKWELLAVCLLKRARWFVRAISDSSPQPYVKFSPETLGYLVDLCSMEFILGEKVEALYNNGSTWYKATVQVCNADGTYDLLYDDGDRSSNVQTSQMRKIDQD